MQIVVIILALLVWAVPASADIVVTLPISGGSVTFSGSPTQGTYANGDPFVVVGGGTTTIVTRTGADTVTPFTNGCQINPVPHAPTTLTSAKSGEVLQGFDSRTLSYAYTDTLNVCDSFPSATIAAGSSIVFATSNNPTGSCPIAPGSNSVACMQYADVVTIISAAPACGNGCAWRPPWAGSDKSFPSGITTKSQIRYNVLHDYTNSGAISSLATIESNCWFRGPLLILAGKGADGWTDAMPSSWCNTPIIAYGRQIQGATLNAMAALSQSATDGQKEVLAIRMSQMAIDLWSQYRAGQYFIGIAGWCWPAKELIVFGASLLDNADMMSIAPNAVSGNKFCTNLQYATITQGIIDTTLQASCGHNGTATHLCVDFTQEMLNRAQWCADWSNVPKCSAVWNPTYAYMPVEGPVGIAVILSEMQLEEEHGNSAYFQYLLNRNNNWGDNRIMTLWRAQFTGECYSGNPASQGVPDDTACALFDTYINEASIDGSLGSAPVTPNEPPTSALTTPSSAATHYTSSATIALAGTAADSDGTVTGTVCASDKDGSITNTGTPTAWACTPDLPSMSVSAITVTSIDDDTDTAIIPVSVLRASSTCTGLLDTFTLSGSWATPNPHCWVNMVGSLLWENNHLRSSTNARNLFYFNSAINNDQMASVTIDVTPTDNVWIYQGVRGSVSGSNYSGMGCTAQNPISYIAKFINTNRTTFATIDMTTTPWVSGDVASCRVIGQEYCLLKNGVVQGSCATDGSSSFTSGYAWAGAWGTATGFSNFVATAQAGGGDIISPVAAITTPTGVLQVAATPYTSMAGTFSDAVGVATGTWRVAENPSENGTVTPNSAFPSTSGTWTIPGGGIDLISGTNTVQVTFTDAASNSTTVSEVISYVPASSVVATFTYPTADATWTQRGRLVDLMGTFTAAQCTSVLLTNVTDPNPVIGGTQVVATGTDSWSARVGLLQYRDEFGAVSGLNDIEISCMDGADGTGTSLLTVHKYVTYIPLKKRR